MVALKTRIMNRYTIASIVVSIPFIIGYLVNEYLNILNSEVSYDKFDYLLGEWSEGFIVALLIVLAMIFLTKWSLSSSMQNVALLTSAWSFYAIVIISLLDLTFGHWGIPSRCGSGFSLGNCFLAEGITEIAYYAVIPIGFAIGTIFLIVNKQLKPKPKQ